jgi:RimJ/RimL family protein N-acetyltransferase
MQFLTSEKIYLRPIEESDIPDITRWLNDPITTHYMFYGQLPKNLQQVREIIMSQALAPQNVMWLVCDQKTGKSIGFCGLHDIHLTAQKAEFRVLIGEADFRGKGLGTEITEMLTFYGFDRLNLHRVYLGVTHENMGGVRAYEKAGYKYEGTLKDDIYRNGRYYDSVRMGILREDYLKNFYQKHLAKFRPSDLALKSVEPKRSEAKKVKKKIS